MASAASAFVASPGSQQSQDQIALQNLALLVQNPTLDGKYPLVSKTHNTESKINYITAIAGLAFAFFSAFAYKRLNIPTAIVFSMISLGAFYRSKSSKEVPTKEFDSQCLQIQQATEGIVICLDLLARAKIEALVNELNGKNISSEKDHAAAAQALLKENTSKYDNAETPYGVNESAKVYNKFLPYVQQLLAPPFTGKYKEPHQLPKPLVDEVGKIRKAAKVFIYGYDKPDDVKLKNAEGYLDVSVGIGGKINAKAWALQA